MKYQKIKSMGVYQMDKEHKEISETDKRLQC
jgi:hypothetical protein